jgi:hypothetical protein
VNLGKTMKNMNISKSMGNLDIRQELDASKASRNSNDVYDDLVMNYGEDLANFF